jgi:hypothetical protein
VTWPRWPPTPTATDDAHLARAHLGGRQPRRLGDLPPRMSCSAQNLPHGLEVSDGRLTTARRSACPSLIAHAPRAPSAPTLTPAPTSGPPYEWQPGSSNLLTASATRDCGRPVTTSSRPSRARSRRRRSSARPPPSTCPEAAAARADPSG